MQQFLWNSIRTVERFSLPIFSIISEIVGDTRNTIFNFFPFFVGLFCRFRLPLIRCLQESHLFQAFLKFPTEQLPLFDFARHLVVLEPKEIFVDVSATHQIIAALDCAFGLPTCQEAVLDCYRAAFETFIKRPHLFDSANRNFLCHFVLLDKWAKDRSL
jgi:hypothetical protein